MNHKAAFLVASTLNPVKKKGIDVLIKIYVGNIFISTHWNILEINNLNQVSGNMPFVNHSE